MTKKLKCAYCGSTESIHYDRCPKHSTDIQMLEIEDIWKRKLSRKRFKKLFHGAIISSDGLFYELYTKLFERVKP